MLLERHFSLFYFDSSYVLKKALIRLRFQLRNENSSATTIREPFQCLIVTSNCNGSTFYNYNVPEGFYNLFIHINEKRSLSDMKWVSKITVSTSFIMIVYLAKSFNGICYSTLTLLIQIAPTSVSEVSHWQNEDRAS